MGTTRRSSAAIVQYMSRPVRQQHNISPHEFRGRARFCTFNDGLALQNHMVGNLVRSGLRPGNTSWRAIHAVNLQLTSKRDHLQKMTQPVDLMHGNKPTYEYG